MSALTMEVDQASTAQVVIPPADRHVYRFDMSQAVGIPVPEVVEHDGWECVPVTFSRDKRGGTVVFSDGKVGWAYARELTLLDDPTALEGSQTARGGESSPGPQETPPAPGSDDTSAVVSSAAPRSLPDQRPVCGAHLQGSLLACERAPHDNGEHTAVDTNRMGKQYFRRWSA